MAAAKLASWPFAWSRWPAIRPRPGRPRRSGPRRIGYARVHIDQATQAESSPNGNSYKCYFRAKLALLTGDKVTCQRELEHLRGVGDKEGARQIASELKRKKG